MASEEEQIGLRDGMVAWSEACREESGEVRRGGGWKSLVRPFLFLFSLFFLPFPHFEILPSLSFSSCRSRSSKEVVSDQTRDSIRFVLVFVRPSRLSIFSSLTSPLLPSIIPGDDPQQKLSRNQQQQFWKIESRSPSKDQDQSPSSSLLFAFCITRQNTFTDFLKVSISQDFPRDVTEKDLRDLLEPLGRLNW